jgi:hypothetical protein
MPLLSRFNDPGLEQGINLSIFIYMLAERARGKVTAAQLQTVFQLDATGVADATTLYQNVLNGHAALTGNTSFIRAREIQEVLTLWTHLVPPYNTEEAVRTRLGL